MIYAMAAMVLLTFIVGTVAVKRRFASVKQGNVDAKYFKLMVGENIPDDVAKSTRNFNNLFEVPLLFYIAATLHIVLTLDSIIGLIFAWLFVVFRYWHSYIHLTYNKLTHRMTIYWLGLFCVLILWLNLLVEMH